MQVTDEKPPLTEFLVDFSRLTQGQAAKLAGKPTSWLREREHLFERNPDDTYDARSFVRALRTDYNSAELDDASLEQVQQLAERFVDHCGINHAVIIKILVAVQEGYGAPGLAVLGESVMDYAQDMRRRFGDTPGYEIPAPDEIRRRAEREIEKLEDRRHREQLRSVIVCCRCHSHRWGKKWRADATPIGYAETMTVCPACEEKYS